MSSMRSGLFVSSASLPISLNVGLPAESPVREIEQMTRFAEVPCDARPAEVMRQKLMTMAATELRRHFSGRVPSEGERLAFIESAARFLVPVRTFVNNLYRVALFVTPISGESFLHLSIARLDCGTRKEWRHLQQIKNELCGPEHEAMEVFPSESRLVDNGHEYHLWVHKSPVFRFPVGWASARDWPVATIAGFPRL